MKFTVLLIVFLNVLLTPWGLASTLSAVQVLVAVAMVSVKILGFLAVLVVVESSLAKLRLFRISEFLSAAFVIAVAAMISQLFTDGVV
ncbi:MAG TPA: formate hydrogenlyase subunit 4, partial [Spirochaetia bacterium]|nr:formate hydrogenlyase subunit 4 [Spirochaetia bacterium]